MNCSVPIDELSQEQIEKMIAEIKKKQGKLVGILLDDVLEKGETLTETQYLDYVFDGDYYTSNHGRVFSIKQNQFRILKFDKDKDNYERVVLSHYVDDTNTKPDRFRVSRLVAYSYVPIDEELKDIPLDQLIVHHKDHNIHNNHAENLAWMLRADHDEFHRKERENVKL